MFKQVFSNMRRSPYQTVAAILIMFISFFVGTVYLMSSLTAQRILTELSSRPQVVIFIKDEVKNDEVETLKKTINDSVKVKEMKYLSKDDALARYKKDNQKDPMLLELVTANILPASLEVSAADATDLSKIYDLAKESSVVEDVTYQQEETKDLLAWVNSIRFSGSILVGLLVFESILVLLIIFAMKISYKKDEIGVMQLVGASGWQVRGPFLIEGMIYGALAGILSWGFGYLFVVVWHINPLGTIPALSEFTVPFDISLVNIGLWGVVELAAGLFIGLLGSFLAVWRYLKN